MKKVLVTSLGDSLESEIDPHFGRCKYLLVCDAEEKTLEKAVLNENANVQGGAGVSTSQMVADMGVDVIITGNVGPKAFEALSSSGVSIYLSEGGSVKGNLEALAGGKLEKLDDSSAPMHTGMGARNS